MKAQIPSMVVTMGEDGAIFADKEGNTGICPARKVHVKDTTGAGDTFNGNLAYCLTHNYPLKEALLKAERGEDTSEMTEWGNIKKIKEILGGGLIAVAGGITPENVEEAIEKGADVIIAGRYIIGSRDVRRAAQDFLEHFDPDPDNMRLAMDEDENIEVKDD